MTFQSKSLGMQNGEKFESVLATVANGSHCPCHRAAYSAYNLQSKSLA